MTGIDVISVIYREQLDSEISSYDLKMAKVDPLTSTTVQGFHNTSFDYVDQFIRFNICFIFCTLLFRYNYKKLPLSNKLSENDLAREICLNL